MDPMQKLFSLQAETDNSPSVLKFISCIVTQLIRYHSQFINNGNLESKLIFSKNCLKGFYVRKSAPCLKKKTPRLCLLCRVPELFS